MQSLCPAGLLILRDDKLRDFRADGNSKLRNWQNSDSQYLKKRQIYGSLFVDINC